MVDVVHSALAEHTMQAVSWPLAVCHPHAGDIAVTITDQLGQTGRNSNNATLVTNPIPGPSPSINNGAAVVNATGGSTVLTNSGTSCPGGDCATYWALSCPNERGSFAARNGSSVTITVGAGGNFDIDTAGLTGEINCTVTMTVVNSLGASANTSTALIVARAPLNCSLAVFTPSILTSRSYPQICAANRVRRLHAAVLERW